MTVTVAGVPACTEPGAMVTIVVVVASRVTVTVPGAVPVDGLWAASPE